MATGLQIFNANGRLIMDTSTSTWNIIDSFVAPANGSARRDYGAEIAGIITEWLVQVSFVNHTPSNQTNVIHSLTGGASSSSAWVSASGGNADTNVVVLGR
jgi:hypothetical protein